MKFIHAILVLCLALTITACGDGHDHKDHDHNGDGDGKRSSVHSHEAKYGGALVEIGDHFAHLEVVAEKQKDDAGAETKQLTGKLTIHVWDGHVQNPIMVPNESIVLDIEDAGEVTLQPVVSENNNWKVGSTPSFDGAADALKGKESFTATVKAIKIKGHDYEGIEVKYPEGNE